MFEHDRSTARGRMGSCKLYIFRHDSKIFKTAIDTIILFRTEDGNTSIEVRLQNEAISLSFPQMAKLFERDKSFISKLFGTSSIQENW